MATDYRFEVWAPGEIVRLRAAADELERSLNLFNAAKARVPAAASNGRNGTSEAPTSAQPKSNRRGPRGSKYAPIFDHWAASSGEAGLTLDDMDRLARQAGMVIDRGNLRSIVWSQKKSGRVVVAGDRYLWRKAEEAAPPQEEQRS